MLWLLRVVWRRRRVPLLGSLPGSVGVGPLPAVSGLLRGALPLRVVLSLPLGLRLRPVWEARLGP